MAFFQELFICENPQIAHWVWLGQCVSLHTRSAWGNVILIRNKVGKLLDLQNPRIHKQSVLVRLHHPDSHGLKALLEQVYREISEKDPMPTIPLRIYINTLNYTQQEIGNQCRSFIQHKHHMIFQFALVSSLATTCYKLVTFQGQPIHVMLSRWNVIKQSPNLIISGKDAADISNVLSFELQELTLFV